MSHVVLFYKVFVCVLFSTALIACGAAPTSVAPVQNAVSTALPARATATLVLPTVFSATTKPQPTGAPTPAATLGQSFALARGQSMPVAGTDLTLTFTDVTEDSRCPRDVDCVWEGQVTVALAVAQGTQAASPLALTLRGTGRQVAESRASVGGHTVQVEAVAPYPGAGTQIAPDDYVVTLRVE